jgi:hypothetical protein
LPDAAQLDLSQKIKKQTPESILKWMSWQNENQKISSPISNLGIVHRGITKADYYCGWHCRGDFFDCLGGDEVKNNLGQRLWDAIEWAQGNSYLSDDMVEVAISDEDIMQRAKNSAYWHIKSAQELKRFIRNYNRETKEKRPSWST